MFFSIFIQYLEFTRLPDSSPEPDQVPESSQKKSRADVPSSGPSTVSHPRPRPGFKRKSPSLHNPPSTPLSQPVPVRLTAPPPSQATQTVPNCGQVSLVDDVDIYTQVERTQQILHAHNRQVVAIVEHTKSLKSFLENVHPFRDALNACHKRMTESCTLLDDQKMTVSNVEGLLKSVKEDIASLNAVVGRLESYQVLLEQRRDEGVERGERIKSFVEEEMATISTLIRSPILTSPPSLNLDSVVSDAQNVSKGLGDVVAFLGRVTKN
jgi:hypothetical protein